MINLHNKFTALLPTHAHRKSFNIFYLFSAIDQAACIATALSGKLAHPHFGEYEPQLNADRAIFCQVALDIWCSCDLGKFSR